MAKKISAPIIIGFILMIGVLGFIAYSVQQSQIDSSDPAALAASCGLDTTLTINAANALSQGTAVISPTYKAIVNGNSAIAFTSGTSKLVPGNTVEILANASDYINTRKTIIVNCGANSLSVELYATDDVAAIEVFNDDGNKVTDDVAGGAINQTSLSSGEALTVEVKFKGSNEESTGDLIYIVEAGSAANITAITMSGDATTLTAIPSIHTTQTAGSKVVAFRIPAIVGAVTKTYDLTFTIGTGKTLSGGVYTDVYSEQPFIDDNGQITVGVQDASGDAKYEDTSDSDFYIDAA